MGDGTAKPEDMKVAVKMGADLAGTIAKLKANGFQYATAGDTRRLIEGIDAAHIAGLKEALEIIRREAVEWGTIGDGLGDILAEEATAAILARISELEGQ